MGFQDRLILTTDGLSAHRELLELRYGIIRSHVDGGHLAVAPATWTGFVRYAAG